MTGFLGGSVPTGSHKNGSISAVVTPTLAGGKGSVTDPYVSIDGEWVSQ